MLSHVWLFATLWTVACQGPLSMDFSGQEYWSGLPFLPPGDLPDPRDQTLAPASPALTDGFFTTEPPGKPNLSPEDSLRITGLDKFWFIESRSPWQFVRDLTKVAVSPQFLELGVIWLDSNLKGHTWEHQAQGLRVSSGLWVGNTIFSVPT